jgi:putative hemolysin
MSPLTTDVLIILLLVIVNGLFVMAEMAIVSARKVRLQQLVNQGDRRAFRALKLANDPNTILAVGQVGITLIAISLGAFGEKALSKYIAPLLERTGLHSYAELMAGALSIIIVTYLTLIVGELVPKRLALNAPEPIAMAVAGPMGALARTAAPIVYLLSASTEIALRLMGIRPSNEPQVTEEEIRVMIEQGTEAGMFEQEEEDIMKRVFQLGDRRVSALMTPRLEIVWLDVEDTPEETRRAILETAHSRFPVCQGELDNLLGLVQVYDLLMESLSGEELNLVKPLQKPVFVPESTRALKVMELFKQTGTQLAFVVDEYGVVQGLVTLTDILQALVGDIPSMEDLEEPQAIQREDGSWLMDGMMPIYQFKEMLEMESEEMPGELRGTYQTLGGFVVMHLGKIPASAEHFVWGSLRFEVMDMDGNRVDKVLVSPTVKAAPTKR